MSRLHIHCPHFTHCSGCVRNENIDELSIFNEARDYFVKKGISSFKLNVGSPHGWRTRAKLAVRGSATNPSIGLFEEGSHQVVNIPLCRVHHPAINQAVSVIKQWMIQNKVVPYDENTGNGLLRYIQLAVERSTGLIQLTLVLNKMIEPEKDVHFFNSLWSLHPGLWHSVWFNYNTRRDNVIFGTEWSLGFGSSWLWEVLCGRSICFHPASFVQANLEMFNLLLERIKELLPENADVVEFYAGVGAIGFALVDKCFRVQCVELNKQAELCFLETRSHLDGDLAKRISFFSGKSHESKHLLGNIDSESGVVIVDPPRKGLDRELLEALCKSTHVKKLIYISCGWQAFQRDCDSLIAAGWHLHHAKAFLFFPGNEQLEILAVFSGRKEKR